MFRNRLSSVEAEVALRLPQPPPTLSPGGFVLCPLACFGGLSAEAWQCRQWLYHRAFEEAWAVTRPSLLERDLLGVWN